MFIRSMELDSCHLSGTQKSQMAVIFLENSRAPDCSPMERKFNLLQKYILMYTTRVIKFQKRIGL